MKRRTRFKFLSFLPKSTHQAIYLCFLLLLLLTIASVVFYPGMQKKIPLFYSLTKSSQQLASREWIFIFPSLSLLIITINSGLLSLIKHYEPIVLKLFAWSTLGIEIIIAMTFIRLILITH